MRQGIPSLLFYVFPFLIAFSISSEEAEVSHQKVQDESVQKAQNDQGSLQQNTTPKVTETPNTVISIDDALFEENTRQDKAQKAYDEQKLKVTNLEENLNRLTAHAKELDSNLDKAKAALKSAYDKMLTVPDFDISKYQKEYQNIWSDVKQNQQDRLEQEQNITEQKRVLNELKTNVTVSETKISDLENNKRTARAKRLYEELTEERTEKLAFTNRCSVNMTLRQCENQTIELALQKSVQKFKKNLLASTTESETVLRNSQNISFNIHILKYDIINSGFQDKNRYQVVLQSLLQSKVSLSTSCQLLNLKPQYCAGKKVEKNQQEIAWFNVTIRSNRYDDNVYIDDVSYGKSPVEVSLPRGIHTLVVKKDGFVTYENSFKLNSDTSIRAVLRQKGNPLKTGYKFKDAVNKQQSGPEVIAVIPGTYYLGEYNATQYKLDHAFAMSATPVTVEQFRSFVKSTNYKTKAELTKTCLVMKNDQAEPDEKATWKSPAFNQTDDSPVVCITKHDAEAYTEWLTEQTGYQYRLPTEEEWEIASRAGKATNYWWGDEFLAGHGNTGWGGTYWSNKKTSPVKSFAPNPWGLYDTVGNVWEWTNAKQGVTRGGAWSFSPATATAFSELYVPPTSSANYIGFRVLRAIR